MMTLYGSSVSAVTSGAAGLSDIGVAADGTKVICKQRMISTLSRDVQHEENRREEVSYQVSVWCAGDVTMRPSLSPSIQIQL